MNILLISSGFGGIYDYFDHSIKKAFETYQHKCSLFNVYKGIHGLIKCVEETKPDLVLTLAGFLLPKEMNDYLSQHHIKQAVWFTEDPFYMDQTLKLYDRYDYIFTIDRNAYHKYLDKGHPSVHLLPLATNTNVFFEDSTKDFEFDINIVGYPYPERLDLVMDLLEKTPYSVLVVGKKWVELLGDRLEHPQLTVIDHWITSREAARYYNTTKICLNSHRPYDLKENQNAIGLMNHSINNRTFDIAACGAFQLISNMEDLPRYFTKNKDIVAFDSKNECLQLIEYYIKEAHQRQEIAQKAKQKVLNGHTFSHRIQTISHVLKQNI